MVDPGVPPPPPPPAVPAPKLAPPPPPEPAGMIIPYTKFIPGGLFHTVGPLNGSPVGVFSGVKMYVLAFPFAIGKSKFPIITLSACYYY
jgi:hypothetical protein